MFFVECQITIKAKKNVLGEEIMIKSENNKITVLITC